jgi:hypothetical protein
LIPGAALGSLLKDSLDTLRLQSGNTPEFLPLPKEKNISMNKKLLITACLLAMIALLTSYQTVLAHEHITVGDYEIEIGWANEPPVAGQLNAIVISVSNTSTGEAQPVENVSSLTVTVSYGGQSKQLTLVPLGEDISGQYQAVILPTIPGQYTVILGGRLGETTFVDAQVEPEEVAPTDSIQFPSIESAAQSADLGMLNWLIYLSLLIGLIALVLGVMALRKSH